MAAKKLSMRKIREILRLKWGEKLSLREVARSVSAAPSTVCECLKRAKSAGLSWPLVDPELCDADLERMLYSSAAPQPGTRVTPDWEGVHRELARKGVTLQLLWQEYKGAHPEDGYQYSQFCERYRRFRSKLDVVLRQHHRAGEKMFVDYSGDGIEITDPRTGKTKTAELFVAVLGASSYTYAEATPTQKLKDWILAHIHAFEFFQGVPGVTVPDNLRSAVTNPCRYEPDLNPTYLEMARHYGTVVIPARPRKPRDKAKAEIGVLLAQRWILAALRNHTFFSIRQANDAIAAKLQLLNHRKFQKLDTTRQELYETIDKPALGPLPSCRYEFAEWLKVRVNIDYHIQVKKHYYSVPYQLVHQKLEVRLTSTTLEALHRGRRVASHLRCDVPFAFETLKEHMPKSHQKHLEWTPSRILHWAEKVGQQTARLVQVVLESRPHPEQGYRSCLGLLRLGKSYGQERLEAACTRALATGACSYRSVKSILSTGLDRLPPPQNHRPRADLPREHGNIRGPAHYQ